MSRVTEGWKTRRTSAQEDNGHCPGAGQAVPGLWGSVPGRGGPRLVWPILDSCHPRSFLYPWAPGLECWRHSHRPSSGTIQDKTSRGGSQATSPHSCSWIVSEDPQVHRPYCLRTGWPVPHGSYRALMKQGPKCTQQRREHPLTCPVVSQVLGCLLMLRLSRLSHPPPWSALIREDWTEGAEELSQTF